MQSKFNFLENKVEQQNKELEQLKKSKTLENEKMLISNNTNFLNYQKKLASLVVHIKTLKKRNARNSRD